MCSIVALIPARQGSKGVPGKNIKSLGGRPLIEWSIGACNASSLIQRTLVSTDSEHYRRLAKSLGAEAPFLRPENISLDTSTDYEFIRHALDWLKAEGVNPDYIVHIRPTTPFRCPNVIDDAIAKFKMNKDRATSLRSVHLMSESAYKTFEIGPQGQLMQIASTNTDLDAANAARQSFPDTYVANGYVDVLSTDFINSSGSIHGNSVLPFVTIQVGEIDTEEDFNNLEIQLKNSPQFVDAIFG